MICKIQFKNKNNNQLFDIAPGETFSDTYNEELDSATTRSVHFRSDSKLDIEPYDNVLLCTDTKINGLFEKEKIIDGKTWYYHLFLVNDIDITQVSVEENPYYNYIISLISPIKELEGIILPNLKITQAWGKSGANGYLEASVGYISPERQPRDEEHKDFDIPEAKGEVYVEGISYFYVLEYIYKVDDENTQTGVVVNQFVDIKVEKVDYYNGTATIKFSYPTEINGVVPITMKLTATINFRYKRSIYHYLSQYVEEYSTTIRKQSKNGALTQKFTLSDKVYNKFRNEICPEMQWNNPTLRQVLNDLMMIKDCIPVIRDYGVIDFIDLSVTDSTPVDMKYINFINSHRSGAEYISELHMELKNVLQSNVDNINNVITVSEYIGFRSDDNIMTTNNFHLVLSNPIYELEKVILCFKVPLRLKDIGQVGGEYSITAQYWYEYDITSLIFEKKEWDVLPYYHTVTFANLWQKIGKYNNTSFYYTRGGKTIDNFSMLIHPSWLVGYKNLFNILIEYVEHKFLDEVNIPNEVEFHNYENKEQNQCWFKITYKTLASCLFRASKNGSNNKKIVIDNQTNSYIDPYSQGLLEYMKVDRTGNEQKTASARYDLAHLDKIAKLGQTIDGAIIYKREIAFHRDYAVVKYLMTPNYVLKDYYTGVRAKIRSWKIADGNDALERHDIRKFYVCLSDKNRVDDITLSNISNCDNAWFFTSFIWQSEDEQDDYYKIQLIKYGLFQYNLQESNVFLPNNGYYALDLSSRIVGMSLCFTVGFQDNYYAGKYISMTYTDKDTVAIGGVGENNYAYVNGAGENHDFKLSVTTTIKSADEYYIPKSKELVYYRKPAPEKKDEIIIDNSQFYEPLLENSRLLPFVKKENVDKYYFSVVFPFHKDNSEITRGTVQFEMLSDNINMYYLGNAFMLWQQTLRTDNKMPVLRLFSGSKDEFTDRRKDDLPTTATRIENFNIVRNQGSKQFTINAPLNTENAYFLTDELNRVILAFKTPENTDSITFYFNVLENLDLNVYDDEGYVVK